MACRRGQCTGIPLCSAANIACIQFEGGTGGGCNGVPTGYSRIQSDTDGNLVVCSNVAGVCTCVDVATGTDTLVDVAGIMQHTAVDGTLQTFCAGIGAILSTNDCPTGGVGPDYMLREATLAPLGDGCVNLQLESAPEHTTVCDTSDAADFVVIPGATAPAGTVINNILPNNLVINNVDPCRDMACMINWTGIMFFVGSLGVGVPPLMGQDRVNYDPVFEVNGAPQFNPLARNVGHNIEIGGVSFNDDHASQGWSGCDTIAPGGNLTITVDHTLEVVNNATIDNIIPQGGSITVLCSTV